MLIMLGQLPSQRAEALCLEALLSWMLGLACAGFFFGNISCASRRGTGAQTAPPTARPPFSRGIVFGEPCGPCARTSWRRSQATSVLCNTWAMSSVSGARAHLKITNCSFASTRRHHSNAILVSLATSPSTLPPLRLLPPCPESLSNKFLSPSSRAAWEKVAKNALLNIWCMSVKKPIG